jgi:hypothetical protein
VNLRSEHAESALDWLYTASTHQILYMVRRRRYEIVLAVRQQQSSKQDETQTIVQVCLKEQDGICRLVLAVGGYVSFETLIEGGLPWFVPLDRAEVLHEIGVSSLAVVCCRA